ncbi:aldehyde dehydrogenase family protein [Aquibacillus koreensis]|uniref:Aldehyde dehydrogenase family protein n=1 Tax=Aquibacillus koreensis TaxID=279446 RepID=A0A9X3WLL8_9BACI|nr:alpha-ketoglutaric semialdehyde dehydrogenase GucD [Aquibacillus koreensis]MCT2537009.1 aldehyde dehydrogenase family protein [Aquibacillus koreensis]MDC3422337.1 aldehyde dehydrogenase family protein [Aquibacillus koreensis]
MSTIAETKTYLNYVNGVWQTSSSDEVIASINPANKHEVVGNVQSSTKADLDQAVAAAKEAQKAWRKLSGADRGNLLFKVAQVIEDNLNDIAETMTREMGKTLPEAKGETNRGVAILRYYAGEGMREVGDVIPSTDSSALMFSKRVPLGVVGVITPWNFPVAIPIWKMAPALIYGNTVVLKPATEGAVTAAKIVECFDKAGFPNGVVNFVTGKGSVIGQGLAEHKDVNAITFTGSNQVGQGIGRTVAGRGGKYQLEMGGKNPLIVAADCDLDLAVDAAISGGLKSTGQKCTCSSRVIVQSSIYEEFKAKLLDKVKDIKVGNGLDESTWMGPCASEGQYNTVRHYIDKGLEEGAALLIGGDQPDGYEDGFYVNPTIFDNVTSSMTIAQEEIFGPVLALMKVDTLGEAIDLANDVEFGLSASIFTKNIDHILTFIDDIEAGLVRINSETAGVELQAPFGGMKASSSQSREQGQAAKEFFTTTKTVFIKG